MVGKTDNSFYNLYIWKLFPAMNKIYCLLFLLFFTSFYSQTKLLSWNLENFGKSKSGQEILFIANTIKDFDIVAIQEVVAGNGGTRAVAKLADELNRKGSKWDYCISDPTSSSAYKTERYAFLWKTKTVKLKGKPWLEQKFHLEIDREPYYATFEIKGRTITIASFHAITKSKQPETEIKYFKFLPQEYSHLNLIFAGDFNCPESHTVFNPLKKLGYTPILQNQKTTLKTKPRGNNYLASEFDNVFYKNNSINCIKSDVILFYKSFNSLQEARKISDHIPIWVEFSLN
jgi:deoxyribonuclease-1-like protein